MTNFHANAGQAKAITAPLDQHVCIIAGAGTGKTETLARRYVRILRETPGIHPRNIVVLTFTEKAATEMRARIMFAVRDERLPFSRLDMAEANIATFHSFAARLALKKSIILDLDQNAPFCDERIASDLTNACWELFLAHGWEKAFAHAKAEVITSVNWDEDKYASLIAKLVDDVQGLALNRTQLAERVAQTNTYDEMFNAIGDALLWNFVHRTSLLQERGQLDLDDIINIVPQLITHEPTLRNEIKFIMVDEYQDTSAAQAQMLAAVTPRQHNKQSHITVVGDPRQAIYVWRQAKVENIVQMRVQSDIPVDLVANHRSLQPILQVANASLRNYQFANPAEFDPHVSLVPAYAQEPPAHDCVSIVRYATIQDEAMAIAHRMRELCEQQLVPYGDMALLFRRRTYINIYTDALQRAGIPFDRGKSDPFYHRSIVIDAIHVATAIIQPHNDISMSRALVALGITDDIGLATIRTQLRKQSLWESVSHFIDSNPQFATFAALQHAFAQSQWYLEPAEWFMQLLIQSKQWERVGAYGQRMLTKLINDCRAIYASDAKDLVETLLSRIMHEPDSASPELMTNNNAVQIMTVHAAKGLEFSAVFVADAVAYKSENETFWTFQTGELLHTEQVRQADTVKEIRRQSSNEVIALWYVALTRAKLWLMISAYRQHNRQNNRFNDLFDTISANPIEGVFVADVAAVPPLRSNPRWAYVPEPDPVVVPITAKRIIPLSPTALHEISICPRRYRFIQRCGMSDVADVAPAEDTSIGLYVQQILSRYNLPQSTPAAPEEHDSDTTPPTNDVYQSYSARILGTLFHAALELHATQGTAATAESLCNSALQRMARPVSAEIRQELYVLVSKYLGTDLAKQIPAVHQVEQSIQWQDDTPDALIEMRCIIDRITATHIIDYKTDHDSTDIALKHGDQLRINALAMQHVNPNAPTPQLAVYHARTGMLYPVDNSTQAMQQTERRINEAAALIVNGTYPAKPDINHCIHCPARPLCPEGQALR